MFPRAAWLEYIWRSSRCHERCFASRLRTWCTRMTIMPRNEDSVPSGIAIPMVSNPFRWSKNAVTSGSLIWFFFSGIRCMYTEKNCSAGRLRNVCWLSVNFTRSNFAVWRGFVVVVIVSSLGFRCDATLREYRKLRVCGRIVKTYRCNRLTV